MQELIHTLSVIGRQWALLCSGSLEARFTSKLSPRIQESFILDGSVPTSKKIALATTNFRGRSPMKEYSVTGVLFFRHLANHTGYDFNW